MGVVRVCLENDSALEGLENVGIEDEDGLENEVADGVTADEGLDICITTSRVIFPCLKFTTSLNIISKCHIIKMSHNKIPHLYFGYI